MTTACDPPAPLRPPVFVPLPGRGAVEVAGPERRDFLQRLLSNDLSLLDTQACVYACLLTAQGKFLHDLLMTEEGESVILECEGGERAEDLARRLSVYRLRAQVEISCRPDVPVFALLTEDPVPPGASCYPDPRHPALGYRSMEQPDVPYGPGPFAHWDRLRLALGIPDGSRDLVPGESTLAEGRIDQFHGVSYQKGCYVGQELTARMHYRSLGKKRLYPVRIEGTPPPPGAEILSDGQSVGQMRSSCGDLGLALLRDDAIDRLRASGPVRPIAL